MGRISDPDSLYLMLFYYIVEDPSPALLGFTPPQLLMVRVGLDFALAIFLLVCDLLSFEFNLLEIKPIVRDFKVSYKLVTNSIFVIVNYSRASSPISLSHLTNI